MKGVLRLASAMALVVFVASCGGGGGSSSSSGSPGSDPGSVPSGPPAIPAPEYSGPTGEAAVGDTNATALGTEMLTMLQTTAAFAYGIPPSLVGSSPHKINDVQAGPNGGDLVTQGRINSDATGWMTEDYRNYVSVEPGTGVTATFDGKIEVRYDAHTSAGSPVVIGFLGLTISLPSGSATLTGSVRLLWPDNGSDPSYSTNLSLRDNASGQYLKAVYQITGDRSDVSVGGRLYDSRLGYVAIQTAAPLRFDSSQTFDGRHWPWHGGPVKLAGGTGNVIVAPLNRFFAYAGVDTNGDGVADEGSRIDWQSLSADTTPTPQNLPEANAWQLTEAQGIGRPIELDGRYSHSPDGSLVHYDWTLEQAPAGSTVQLQNEASAVATLTPDVAGDYLVRLDASNATGASTDTITVSVPPYQPKPTDSPPAQRTGYDAGADRVATINEPVKLDGRTSKAVDYNGATPTDSYTWRLYVPPGSQAVLNDSSAVQPTFTPDVPGYYYATLEGPSSPANVTVLVGESAHFDPYATVILLPDSSVDDFAVGDLNGDGLPDIAISSTKIDGSPAQIYVLYNRSGGRFSSPTLVTAGNGSTLAIGDINGDGRDDLVAGAAYGFDYALQQADGTLGAVVQQSFTTACTVSFPAIAIAPLFGQTRNSVIEANSCDNGMEIFPPDPTGAVSSGRAQTTTAEYINQILAADVSGDGIADLVSDNPSTATGDTLQAVVLAGKSDGTFAAEADYPGGASNSITYPLAVADFNGDGRNDVGLFSRLNGDPGIDMFYQTDTGSLAPAQFIPTADTPYSIAAGDINNDGRADLTILHDYFDASGNHLTQLGLYLQQPDGTLSEELLYPMPALQEMWPAPQQKIVDINGDGVADIVYYQNHELRIRLGDPLGAGSTVTQTRSEMPARSRRLPSLGHGVFRHVAAVASRLHG